MMSQTKTFLTTTEASENPRVAEITEDCGEADNNNKSLSKNSSSPDRSVRERVLKEVGLTSTAFIGPAFPPETNSTKSEIEDSLSEFYKELQAIDTPHGANGNSGQQDAGLVQPSMLPETNTTKETEEKIVNTRTFTETDGAQNCSGLKPSSWPHWYKNEPYYPRRPRPGSEMISGDAVSNQNQWHYPHPVDRPPNPRFYRPPLPHKPPPPAYPDHQNPPPRVNHSFSCSGMTNRHQDELYFQTFPRFPPPHVRSEPTQGFYRYSPHHFDRDDQGGSYYRCPDNVPVRRCSDRPHEWSQFEEYSDRHRNESENEQWEPQHHYQASEHAPAYPSTLVLILIRGLPGSGKSTLAKELLSTGPSGIILSTDDYFAHKDGYHYDPGLIGAAHEWNHSRAKAALCDGRSPIIIDNTNIQAWEMKPYVKMALERGYKVDFCEPDTSWKFDPYELGRRNKHGVPREKIAQMLDRFLFPISIDVVMNSQEPSHVMKRRQQDQPHMMRKNHYFH
ncbi:NEDD4-binding protein 2-like 2 [Parambassis ranga]|uniref:NEDD4-binding protein 2-like 2 n=1 Tax=Parambassis ranga TaxID=210632 RepID=A0A6P7JEY0_9TELE|nr:NEDD4-binding protein 2-like 2 [Parambassis ranga]